MICCRNHPIPQNELFSLLWGDEGTTNPVNALKTMFHRVRSMLDGLGTGAGHTLIVRREGSYTWNDAVPVCVDVEEFESLCQSAAALQDPQAQLKAIRTHWISIRAIFFEAIVRAVDCSSVYLFPQSLFKNSPGRSSPASGAAASR